MLQNLPNYIACGREKLSESMLNELKERENLRGCGAMYAQIVTCRNDLRHIPHFERNT